MSWFKRPIYAWLTLHILGAALLAAIAVIIYGSQRKAGNVWPATYFALAIGLVGLIASVARLIADLRNPEMRKHLLTPRERDGDTPSDKKS